MTSAAPLRMSGMLILVPRSRAGPLMTALRPSTLMRAPIWCSAATWRKRFSYKASLMTLVPVAWVISAQNWGCMSVANPGCGHVVMSTLRSFEQLTRAWCAPSTMSHPAERSLLNNQRRSLGRMSLDDDVAVRRGGRDHVRSRLDVVGGHVVRGPVEQTAAALDDDQLGADPGDVRAHADEASRQVIHVRLARGVADDGDALGEHRRHHQVLRAGDSRHVERDSRPVQAPGTGEVRAVALLDLGAHQSQPLEVLLHAAHADVVTTGLGDARLAGASRRARRAAGMSRASAG